MDGTGRRRSQPFDGVAPGVIFQRDGALKLRPGRNTPQKINMEPENHPFGKENHLQTRHF